ncbi:CIA30 family protein [Paraglaciecola sp. L3A3]|uniref:CIA30 family protein n=1 Tax=Paraglaciecola sp. L3A3 TaxID=2686358 RepID=UPI00131E39DB|nr:CIA30 family protein [Paraglaciecola sp. L3A3]
MKPVNKSIYQSFKTFSLVSVLALSGSVFAAPLNSVIDDFDNTSNNNLGIPRMSLSDITAGGSTTTELMVSNGVIQIKGEIVPPRGQPGWSSLILPLGPEGEGQDANKFVGIKLLVKISNGSISISANSTEVVNYDYHSAQIAVNSDGKFHEIKIPFDSMKRMWSEQTPLNRQTLNSLSIVAFGMQKTLYDFEIDQVSFY